MGSSLFALSYFISIFVRMKRLVVLLFLLGSIIPMTGQTIVELRKGATTVRSKNLHDYDVQTKDTRQEREDSLKYADNLKWAYNYLHSDSLNAAERLFRECLRLRPKAPGNNIVRRSLGQIALAQGRYREAIETFTEVLRLNPSDHGARMDRATAYLQNNNPQACITDCDLLMRCSASFGRPSFSSAIASRMGAFVLDGLNESTFSKSLRALLYCRFWRCAAPRKK